MDYLLGLCVVVVKMSDGIMLILWRYLWNPWFDIGVIVTIIIMMISLFHHHHPTFLLPQPFLQPHQQPHLHLTKHFILLQPFPEEHLHPTTRLTKFDLLTYSLFNDLHLISQLCDLFKFVVYFC